MEPQTTAITVGTVWSIAIAAGLIVVGLVLLSIMLITGNRFVSVQEWFSNIMAKLGDLTKDEK